MGKNLSKIVWVFWPSQCFWTTPCWVKQVTRLYIKRCLFYHSVYGKLFSSHIYALLVKRNCESTVVNVISSDFSRSPFTKSKFNHANLDDYNLIVLNELILQKRKSVFDTLSVLQEIQVRSLKYLSIHFCRDFKLHSFLFLF